MKGQAKVGFRKRGEEVGITIVTYHSDINEVIIYSAEESERKRSRIRETLKLSMCADSSTDTKYNNNYPHPKGQLDAVRDQYRIL